MATPRLWAAGRGTHGRRSRRILRPRQCAGTVDRRGDRRRGGLGVYLIARRREAPAWRRAWNSVDDPGALNRFATARAAKDYLADRIVEEANRRQESISDLERRMLYFTEEDGDPSMLDLNDEFERQYDMDQYEAKISRLIKSGLDRTYRENKDELGVWYDAISTLA